MILMDVLEIMLNLAIALVLTILIESAVAYCAGMMEKKDYINLMLINIITNLSLNVISLISSMVLDSIILVNLIVIVLELSLILSEGLMIKKYIKYDRFNPFLFAFILNVSSYLIGVIIL